MNKEAKGQDMNVEDVRDDVEDSASSSVRIQRSIQKLKITHQKAGEEMKIQKSLENLKS